jgi:tRNA (guanine37-N1)-methyltransferase
LIIHVLTLFPEELSAFFKKGIFKRAAEAGLFELSCVDLRPFGKTKYMKVDDYPFGHRRGMILRADVIKEAIESIPDYGQFKVIYTCPKGKVFNQDAAVAFSSHEKGLIILSGFYEGVDERIFDWFDIERVSLGDFVLSSGDVPALAIAESVFRLIPGVLGNPESVGEDSIISGLLEGPQYTGPRKIGGISVPEVLISGHHGNIRKWRQRESLKATLFRKPSLLVKRKVTDSEKKDIILILKEE